MQKLILGKKKCTPSGAEKTLTQSSGWNLTAFHFTAGYKSFFVGTESKFMQAASLRTLTIQAKETRHPTSFIKELISIALKSFPNLSTVAISFPLFEELDDFLHWLDDRPIEEDEDVDADYCEESYRREVKFCKDSLEGDEIHQSGVMTALREMLGEESYYEEAMDLTPESELAGINWESCIEKPPELPFFWGKAVWQAMRGRTLKEKKVTKELTDSQAMEVCELDSEDWPELEDSDKDWWNSW